MPNQINQTKQTKRFTPMKTQKFALLIALFSLFILGACEKKEVKPNKTALLTEKTWKPNEAYVDGKPATTTAPQVLTWRYEFRNNGTYTWTSAGNSVPGVWEFNTDQTKIILDKASSSEEAWDIQNLEKGKLNIKSKVEDEDGYLHDVELKLIHAN
jgi:hypothetical protein